MCTHFTPTQRPHWIKSNLGVVLPTEFPAETFPGYLAPIVVKSHRSGRLAAGLARFGLIPAWAKDPKIGRHTYNARTETVADKPSYRSAWRKRQFGLVPVDHFFEPSYATLKAVPWMIRLTSGDPFCLACIWDRWNEPDTGLSVASFSLLTINADHHPVMRQFHREGDEKRTPVVIPPDRYVDWLSADPTQAMEFLNTQDMPELQAHPHLLS